MWASSIRAGYFPYENRMKDNEKKLLPSQYTYRGCPPASCVRVLEEGLIIGRKTSDMNSAGSEGPLQDFIYDGHKVAWFSTDESGDKSIDVLRIADSLLLKKYSQEDDIQTCLSDYLGKVKYYKLNSNIRLWDMSKLEALELIRRELDENDIKLFESCFRWNEHFQQVVRHSDDKLDIELCKRLMSKNIINSNCPGWYHPTMLAFNEEILNIEKIHRREIVLLNPLTFIENTVSETGTPKRLEVSFDDNDKGDFEGPTRKQNSKGSRSDGSVVKTLSF